MKLEIENLTKRFQDVAAVDGGSCTLTTGVYGLLGVNGAGKTTLMRMLCTLLKPTGGRILWDGKDIFELGGAYRRVLGYLPQDFGFYPDFTVRDYLRYISSIKGLRPAAARQRTALLLQQVGLEKAENKKMKKLSGGMKRRVGIAQAMLNDPEILILDEPTAGLDPKERIRFRNIISAFSRNRIVILSTHIVSDVEYIADRILLMKQGELILQGNLSQVTEKLRGCVWECTAQAGQAEALNERYAVSNLRNCGDKVSLRIVAEEKPTEDALPAEPNLEDVYLYYFTEKESREG